MKKFLLLLLVCSQVFIASDKIAETKITEEIRSIAVQAGFLGLYDEDYAKAVSDAYSNMHYAELLPLLKNLLPANSALDIEALGKVTPSMVVVHALIGMLQELKSVSDIRKKRIVFLQEQVQDYIELLYASMSANSRFSIINGSLNTVDGNHLTTYQLIKYGLNPLLVSIQEENRHEDYGINPAHLDFVIKKSTSESPEDWKDKAGNFLTTLTSLAQSAHDAFQERHDAQDRARQWASEVAAQHSLAGCAGEVASYTSSHSVSPNSSRSTSPAPAIKVSAHSDQADSE